MPLKDNYSNGIFRPNDAIVISQDDFYSLAWEAESDPSPLDCPTIYPDPVATEPTNNRNAVTKQNNDEHSPHKYRDASDLVNDKPHSNKFSSQDHVNCPKIDLRNEIEAPNENDNMSMSKPCHDLNSRQDTESTTSTQENVPTNNGGISQDETFSRGGKYNLRPNTKPNFSEDPKEHAHHTCNTFIKYRINISFFMSNVFKKQAGIDWPPRIGFLICQKAKDCEICAVCKLNSHINYRLFNSLNMNSTVSNF